ncbi:DEAD/DEAH box helicase domain [Dillenia turbinata]|uniref:DEAD/DEAH box helicase domain n=1 Tax=Dillenia turbinata TaxID=194707 RepID=A0AAN8VU31_9MAGN
MGGTGRALLALSLSSSNFLSLSLLSHSTKHTLLKFPKHSKVLLGFRPLCSSATTTIPSSNTIESESPLQPVKHSILLERLRHRHLKDSANAKPSSQPKSTSSETEDGARKRKKSSGVKVEVSSFEELGLGDEVLSALKELGISAPTEIQCLGIPNVLDGKSVVLGSHTGSGKTLAYMLPLVQLLRRDEALHGMLMKPRRPRAVVLCPTRELSEQVFRVAKSISHHARFRSVMVSGGGRIRPQEDALNVPIDMVVGTPGRVLQHIEDGNMVYGDIKYLVLDEADTMFDRGFGPDIRKFLGPLKNRASKSGDQGFQTVLVTATMTKAVQKLVDEEFQGIVHLRTSTLHKKIASARHDFIKLSGAENKLEALLQVLEPSLAKGNKVMVFCNTLNSSRAVDHFLSENQIFTVNYHGEVPAEQRVENLKKFKSEDGDCPTLVCTDLAARGLDLDVDHIDYLHRTGRTARMGAKGKVTSLVSKRELALATRIEEAIQKNESLESLTIDNIRRDIVRAKVTEQRGKAMSVVKASSARNRTKNLPLKSASANGKAVTVQSARKKPLKTEYAKTSIQMKSKKSAQAQKTQKSSSSSGSKRTLSGGKKYVASKMPTVKKSSLKLSVVGFRGRSRKI